MRAAGLLACWLACMLALTGAHAQTVTLNGSMGDRALLVIDGEPRTLPVGASARGVKLLALAAGEATVELPGGKRATLRIGATQVSVGGDAGGEARRSGREIVLPAGPGGHFYGDGSINGKPVRFLVDTGATAIALGKGEADRIGLAWRNGQRGVAQTANGPVPASRIVLASVRLGDVVVYDVPAIVVPAAMDHVLLGNSFLGRFQMRRDNDLMRLEKKP